MSTDKFTGKAEAYAKARPGYPNAAIDYIASLVPENAVIADIGAGTGKFTELLAKCGFTVFAVEPNDDMRTQLFETLKQYPNAKIINGSAEATTLPDNSVDVVTCAQALHWFDPEAFRTECRRIANGDTLVIALFNSTSGGSSAAFNISSTETFYTAPIVREFPNPIYYTRESWLTYMSSHSHSPLPTDEDYAKHMAEMNTVFNREQVDGLLCTEVVTKVYSEVLK
jgi:ubiquinone/menaquinone biosynthesis C-methylase UbiE